MRTLCLFGVQGPACNCKLRAPAFNAAKLNEIAEDPVPSDAVICLVDSAHLESALSYHSINSVEIPVGFVFTDLGDWTMTLSHQVMESIADPTVNIFVSGADPRDPENEQAWPWHTYEVCDAMEPTAYDIVDIWVSNFVRPSYFSTGSSRTTRNDFFGIAVDSFGLLPGRHLKTVDPVTYEPITHAGSQHPSHDIIADRLEAFSQGNERSQATGEQEATLQRFISARSDVDPEQGSRLSDSRALRRSTPKGAFFGGRTPGAKRQAISSDRGCYR